MTTVERGRFIETPRIQQIAQYAVVARQMPFNSRDLFCTAANVIRLLVMNVRFLILALVLAASSVALGEFKFKHHFIERDLPAKDYGQTSLVDVDRDGDLDFITGGKDPQKHIFWFEYQGPDKWVRHVLGSDQPSDVGGTAFDVDGDGWIDHVSGGAWYRNTGKPREEPFERIVFDKNLTAVHDLVAADIDGDGKLDIVDHVGSAEPAVVFDSEGSAPALGASRHWPGRACGSGGGRY